MMEASGLKSKDDNFQAWLDDIIATYKSFSNDKKNTLLDSLIINSEVIEPIKAVLEEFLNGEHLFDFLHRDFISFLPEEIVTSIVKYLDVQQILRCCQVSKSWNQCINSLVKLWRIKAFQFGVNVQNVSSVHELSTPGISTKAGSYKQACCQAARFLHCLKKRKCHVEILTTSFQNVDSTLDIWLSKEHVFAGLKHRHELQVWSLPDFDLERTINISKNCGIWYYKDAQIFLNNINATLQSWNVITGAKMHSFIGHTSLIIAIDVTDDKKFVITGSMDKSVKLWDVRKGIGPAEIFLTLDHAHKIGVSQVLFLPCDDKGQLRFISGDSNGFHSWSVSIKTKIIETSHVTALDKGLEMFSYFIDFSKSNTIFISQWDFSSKQSFLSSYELHKDTRIDLKKSWLIPLKGVKASIVGVGSRFAVVICTISCQDFHFFDLATGSCLFKIVTPEFRFGMKRNKSNVRLYHSYILDGLESDWMQNGKKLFEGVDPWGRYKIARWYVPEFENEDFKDDD